MSRSLAKVRSAIIDGRMTNVYWRQDQLSSLHTGLIKYESELLSSAVSDAGCTAEEAKVEFYLTLSLVKTTYQSLDPADELLREYSVVHGRDDVHARKPVGAVYIEPTNHTLLYSTLSAVCVAIAAGNCIVLQLENDLRAVPRILKNFLESALDTDIFFVSQARESDLSSLGPCVKVLQNDLEDTAQSAGLSVVSPSRSPVVAVIDRTADLEAAAQAIALSRFAFSGRSPYAPDLVLVNEFAKNDFLNAITKHSIPFLTRSVGTGANARKKKAQKSLSDDLRDQSGARFVYNGDVGSIVEVSERSLLELRRRVTEPSLLVHAVRSLDDGIDLVESNNACLLSLYAFGDAPTCKYLAQSINTRSSFLNHIPSELLVGPAAPATVSALPPGARYDVSAFSLSSPQYIHESPRSASLKEFLKTQDVRVLSGLREEAAKGLVVAKHNKNPKIGFFETGILYGLATGLVPIIAAVTTIVLKRQWIWSFIHK